MIYFHHFPTLNNISIKSYFNFWFTSRYFVTKKIKPSNRGTMCTYVNGFCSILY